MAVEGKAGGGGATATTAEQSPDFLVIGHVVKDLLDGHWRPGGAVTYAGLLARNLGLRAAVLTSCADDFAVDEILAGVDVRVIDSPDTTQIRNIYTPEGRKQWVPRRAVTGINDISTVPSEWRDSPIVLLGPVAGEMGDGLAAMFPNSLVGVGAQGWLREIGADHEVKHVAPGKLNIDMLFGGAAAAFVSGEDLPGEEISATVERWSRMVEIVALTRGDGGADVCYRGEWRHVDAFPATSVDPTGAGDVFAAAFLIRFGETGDPWAAATFAAAAASCLVEGEGTESVPNRPTVEERLASHPEIEARVI